MIEPARYDINVYKGDTFILNLTWSDDDEEPYDLSAYSARMQIRTTVDAPTTLISLTNTIVDNQGITLGNTSPNITVTITASATANLPGLTGYYDLHVMDSNNVSTRILYGKVTIVPSVTRP